MSAPKVETERWRKYWDRHSKSYDREMAFFDRRLFGDSRDWVCRQAVGNVLEVAIGTGLNLEHYPREVRLTGIEFSPAMLDLARDRATSLSREIDLHEGDAQLLESPTPHSTPSCARSRSARSPTNAKLSPRCSACSNPAGCCYCRPCT